MLEIEEISKKYDKYVLKDVSLTVSSGEIMAIIGSNGSGKTTLMKIICGLIPSTSGTYTWKKNTVSNMIENPGFFPYLTGFENLRYFQIQKGCIDSNKINEVLNVVNLMEHKDKKYKKYSLGMKQKLALALCLLENPDFLVLDEPTNGVDIEGVISIRHVLKELNSSKNVTMLISSHNLHELYNLATSFCFLKDGVIKEVTKKDTIREIIDNSLIISCDDTQSVLKFLDTVNVTIEYKLHKEAIHIFNVENIEELKTTLRANVSSSLKIKPYDIEDYFLSVMEGE